MEGAQLTHDELTRHAERWLREDRQCWPTNTEATNNCTKERVDAVGWTRFAWCISAEIKTSEEDLNRDADKPHRGHALGNERYIFAQRYVFEPFQIVGPWGLAEYDPETGQVYISKAASKLSSAALVNYAAQQSTLIQMLRDSQKGGGDAEAGRRSQRGHIPQRHHGTIAVIVRDFPGSYAIDVAKSMRNYSPKTRRGTVAKWIADDARSGLIPGVRAEGVRAQLYPTD